MNTVAISGRLSADPEYKQSGETTITRFTVAVNRRGKDKGADFFRCVAFGKTADFISKYFVKGQRIILSGELNKPDRYKNQNDTWVYPEVQIIVRDVDFGGDKSENPASASASAPAQQAASNPASAPVGDNSFMSIPDGVDEELPFA